MHLEILEGTTRAAKVEVTADTQTFLITPLAQCSSAPVVATLDKMLTHLSMHLAYMTQISNCQVCVCLPAKHERGCLPNMSVATRDWSTSTPSMRLEEMALSMSACSRRT